MSTGTIAVILNFRIFWYVDIVFTSVLHLSVVFKIATKIIYTIMLCAKFDGDNIIVQ